MDVLHEVVKIGAHVQESMELEAFYRATTLFLFCMVLGRPLLGLFCVGLLWNMSVHTAPGFRKVLLCLVSVLKMMELFYKGTADEPYPPGQEFAEEARRRAANARQVQAQEVDPAPPTTGHYKSKKEK